MVVVSYAMMSPHIRRRLRGMHGCPAAHRDPRRGRRMMSPVARRARVLRRSREEPEHGPCSGASALRAEAREFIEAY